MRILVYPHTMEIGGSQLNAIQLAGAIRDRGHEVIVLSEPGPLVEYVRALGLEHLEISIDRRRPSPRVLGLLAQIVRERHVDVVHGHEWPPIVEAFFGAGLMFGTPVVGSVMGMFVRSFVPRTVPLMVGTEGIREAAIAAGHRRVTLLEPPVDVETDDPHNPSVNGREFRTMLGVDPEDVLVVIICRLVLELKLEGLLSACDAVGQLARNGYRVRLVIVGDGPEYEAVVERAAKANAAAGYQAVRLTGEMSDPRPAYAASDVVIGQGGSALRGMAFGKPLVVVGEDGYSELLTPMSAPIFLRQGWYGLGRGSLGSGAVALRDALEGLVKSLELRRQLGAFGRQLVVDRFTLKHAAEVQEMEYFTAVKDRIAMGSRILDISHSALGILDFKLRRKYQRWRDRQNKKSSEAPDSMPQIQQFSSMRWHIE